MRPGTMCNGVSWPWLPANPRSLDVRLETLPKKVPLYRRSMAVARGHRRAWWYGHGDSGSPRYPPTASHPWRSRYRQRGMKHVHVTPAARATYLWN